MLTDKGFQIPSPSAKEAHLAASQMLEWLASHPALVESAVEPLTSALVACFHGGNLGNRSRREKMWGRYHEVRTSAKFTSSWAQLMKQSLGKRASPIFYQYVTDVMFKELVKQHTPMDSATHHAPDQSEVPALDCQETTALRYAAGYIIRALQKRLHKKSSPLEQELRLCLVELSEENADEDGDASTDWTTQISRGGLYFINNRTYLFFYAMEMRIRRHLTTTSAPTISAGFKSTMTESILTNEDVLFYWTMVAAEWEEEVEKTLLQMICDLWITVRGFSFARSWLEMYKQSQKKTTQKSKGVRKQLIGKGSSSTGNHT